MPALSFFRQLAARNGLNLLGVVDARRFDRSQPKELRTAATLPGCGTVLAVGTAGRSFWAEFQQQGVAAALDARAAEVLVDASVDAFVDQVRRLKGRVRRVGPEDGRLNFGHLAEAAGFGIVSPVSGMVLHPEFGPWMKVRAAVLLEGRPFGAVRDASLSARFKPCCSCDRPCVSACPSGALDGLGGNDRAQCADHRAVGGCASLCSARGACPVGADHADRPELPLHAHSVDLATLQRRYGRGWWRFVPRSLRGAQATA